MHTPLILARAHLLTIIIATSALLVAIAFADIISGSSSVASSADITITQLTIAKPVGVIEGDLLFAHVAVNGGSPINITPPTGWNLILRTDNNANTSLASYWKVATNVESSSYTWTISPQTRAVGGITKYSGVDITDPIDAFAGNFGQSNTAVVPSVTTSEENDLVIAAFAFNAGATLADHFSTPAGMEEQYDTTNTPAGPSLASADMIQAAAGPSGTKSSLVGGGPKKWVAHQIALRPATLAPAVNGLVTTRAVNDTASTATFSHTVNTGSNQLLIVTMTAAEAGEDISATYGGVPMIKGAAHGVGFRSYYNYWYLASPPQGTYDLVVTFPSGCCRKYAAVTFDGVNQITPLGADGHASGGGGDPAVSVTTTVPNELILYFVDNQDNVTTYTPNDPILYAIDNRPVNGYINTGAVHFQPQPTVTSIGGTLSNGGPGGWDLIAIPIRPAP